MEHTKWELTKGYKDICISLLQDNLAALRAKAGITQEQLAIAVGISRQTYHSIETGKRNMSWTIYLSLVFIFKELLQTCEMIDELKVYPLELFMAMNGEL